jgi:AcrR family transcriptional regulator
VNTRRGYRSPVREASAARTRESILAAALTVFEQRGWAGATVAAIADEAGVSPKTIELTFGTKAALLADVADYAIRGDTDVALMIERPSGKGVEEAPDALTMVRRHAVYATAIDARSARIAAVVEAGAAGDERVAELWARMTHNRRFGARWAAKILMSKKGRRRGLTEEDAYRVFLLAIDWSTYRLLTGEMGLDHDGASDWIARLYERTLLAP